MSVREWREVWKKSDRLCQMILFWSASRKHSRGHNVRMVHNVISG
jgi:hypothetical protein